MEKSELKTGESWRIKRNERFAKWMNPPGIVFDSTEVEQAYKERATRLIQTIQLQEPDRVPCHIPPGSFPAYYAGFDLKTVTYDTEKLKQSWMKFALDVDADAMGGAAYAYPGPVYELLDFKLYQWPGHGLADHVPIIQFIEKVYMKDHEYDLFINNPTDYILRYFMPRTWGVFEPLAHIGSLGSLNGAAHQLLRAARTPEFRTMIDTLTRASDMMVEWEKVVMECEIRTQQAGYPQWGGAMTLSPFDTVADMLRGTQGAMLDLFRRPGKLLDAIERIIPLSLQSVMEMSAGGVCPLVFIPLHKGCDQFMSEKHFAKFYWPSFRKLLLGMIEEGLLPAMVVDGTYSQGRLEMISDLPKGSVIWTFEQTDMALAKKILGGKACIAGNVTGPLLYTGTTADVEKYCRWLIDTCAPGGGYILGMGMSVDKVDPQNIFTIVRTAQKYGHYRK